MPDLTLPLENEAATADLAARIARLTRPGDAILLHGPLGAGKSTFVRAFLRAESADPNLEVPSPTYTLVQSYPLPRFTAHHFDLWRLSGPADLEELGWDEARADVVLVEWPERLEDLAPADALVLTLTPLSETARRITLSGWPDRIATL